MKKSLSTALGLAVALAVSAPALISVASAAPATTAAAPTTTVKKVVAPKHHMKQVHKTVTKKVVKKPAAE
ncbi:hypothetical protein [Phyllobacterium lublinensis]|uniref:hypothetical protein n=1 Tax=Phyllobacterium lublinensis TaxID=2875708 RepID=UPI001CD039E7|nr:hypothetical protein [Phyllobacterium sp. 2063]MBZ9654903.1 hypothetical protein [Phyllobacterium sp. 2063]